MNTSLPLLARRYGVHSIFPTIQGEGYHAGTPALFVRMLGCNIWSGYTADRLRDAQKGSCASWCDTEFTKPDPTKLGGHMTATTLVNLISEETYRHSRKLVVFTGGEPLLQLDEDLLLPLRAELTRRCMPRFLPTIAVETNGTRPRPGGIDWLTVSPKPPSSLALREADELKLVYPAFDPDHYSYFHSRQKYLMPLDTGYPEDVVHNTELAARYVMENPGWRLGVQLHKIAGIP